MKITHETDGVNAYKYLYGYAERKAYEQGYEDGAYRRQQMPQLDVKSEVAVKYRISLTIDDRNNSIEFDPTTTIYYYEGWNDGYSNSQPSSR